MCFMTIKHILSEYNIWNIYIYIYIYIYIINAISIRLKLWNPILKFSVYSAEVQLFSKMAYFVHIGCRDYVMRTTSICSNIMSYFTLRICDELEDNDLRYLAVIPTPSQPTQSVGRRDLAQGPRDPARSPHVIKETSGTSKYQRRSPADPRRSAGGS